MAGTKEGGKKAAITNKTKYGELFYTKIGRQGGKISRGGGFSFIDDPEENEKRHNKAVELGRKGGSALLERDPAYDYSYNCQYCGLGFMSSTGLKYHKGTKHVPTTPEPTE